MKLKGTITEDNYRAELIRTHEYIFKSPKGKRLRKALLQAFPEMKSAYILYWIPEEGEDLYTIVVDGTIIAFIEIEKIIGIVSYFRSPKTSVSSCSVQEYKKGLRKTNQIQLEVAVNLSKSLK